MQSPPLCDEALVLHEQQRPQRESALEAVNSSVETVDVPVCGQALCRLRSGDRIAGTRIEITGFLGQGTSAQVYEGRHVGLDRMLAIKVLRDVDASEVVRERFLAEARLSSRLHSPFLVEVLDSGQLTDGRSWYAMEKLSARSLESVLSEGPLSVRRTIQLMRMICKGLEPIHTAGFVHRDLKPANLVFDRDEPCESERLVLVDLGLATSAGASDSTMISGTPAYMAPEQIRAEQLDGRVDIYALGCCAYEMVCGHPYAEGDAIPTVLAYHLTEHELYVPPGIEVPEVLLDIITRCTAPRPDDRFESVEELELALCEAQISLGLVDQEVLRLDVPNVDHQRRRAVINSMVSPVEPSRARRPSRWAWASAAVVGIVAVSMFAVTPTHADVRIDEASQGDVSRSDSSMMSVRTIPPMPTSATSREVARSTADEGSAEPADQAELEATLEGSESSLETEPEGDAPVSRKTERSDSRKPTSSAARSKKPSDRAAPDPSGARRLVRKARRAARKGDDTKALALYHSAVELDPSNEDGYFGIASIEEKRGHRGRARHFARLGSRTATRASARPSASRRGARLASSSPRVNRG